MKAIDLFDFLTTEPNANAGAVHPKVMPVILTKAEEPAAWMRLRGASRSQGRALLSVTVAMAERGKQSRNTASSKRGHLGA